MTRDELYIELEGCAGPGEAMPYIDQYIQADRERIAQAIEALPIHNGGHAITPAFKLGHRRAQNHAARIARAES